MSDDDEIPRDLCDLNAEILGEEVFRLQERCGEIERQARDHPGLAKDHPDLSYQLMGEYRRLVERIKQVRRLQEYFK